MFDAALAPPGEPPVAAAPKPGPAIHPAALAGALLLHLAGFGLLVWAAASRDTVQVAEPAAIELTLETVATEAPAAEPAPSEAPEPEPEPPEVPPPEPETPPPPVEPPPPEPPPEPPPPVRTEAVAPPPPAPRPRPARPPRERRAAPASPSAAPSAAPPAAAPAPAAPAGPPVVTQARFRRPPTPPDYPLVARERGVTGTVLIRARVGADGETKEVRVQRSSGHEILDGAALAAVRRWSFEPSSRDGQRIESWIEVPIRFQLR